MEITIAGEEYLAVEIPTEECPGCAFLHESKAFCDGLRARVECYEKEKNVSRIFIRNTPENIARCVELRLNNWEGLDADSFD